MITALPDLLIPRVEDDQILHRKKCEGCDGLGQALGPCTSHRGGWGCNVTCSASEIPCPTCDERGWIEEDDCSCPECCELYERWIEPHELIKVAQASLERATDALILNRQARAVEVLSEVGFALARLADASERLERAANKGRKAS